MKKKTIEFVEVFGGILCETPIFRSLNNSLEVRNWQERKVREKSGELVWKC